MIGKTISHYKILSKLGEGGMGVVYKAEDTKLRRTVALKFLSLQALGTEEEKTRFIHEAQAAARIDHANVCPVHAIETIGQHTFIVMAYIEGDSLDNIRRSRPLAVETALDLAAQIARGLARAHKKGIVHRDVKPANVRVTPENEAKVVDFGLARVLDRTRLTKSGISAGTVAYMSPEQALGEEIDARSDIFSLGVVLYEMLTGKLPFKGDVEAALLYGIVNVDPPSLSEAGVHGLHPAVQEILDRMLAKSREERYASAEEVAKDIERVLRGHAPQLRVRRRPTWGRLAMIVTAAIVVAVSVWLVLWFGGEDGDITAIENRVAIMPFDNIADPGDESNVGEMVSTLLSHGLSQSQVLRVISTQRIRDIFGLEGGDGGETRPSNMDVATAAGARWMIEGTILQSKPFLVITAQTVDVRSGEITSSHRVTGAPGETEMTLVDRLLRDIIRDAALPAAAQEEYHKVTDVTTSSREAYRLYLEGIKYQAEFRHVEAKSSLEAAIAEDTTFAMAYWALSGSPILSIEEQHRALAGAVRHASRVNMKERNYIESRRLLRDGDVAGSLAKLHEIITVYPDEKYAFFLLGGIYMVQAANFEKAIVHLERACELDPRNQHFWNRLAYARQWAGDYDGAIDAVNRTIEIDPGQFAWYDTRGDIYASSGNLIRAIESYKRALELNPGSWETAVKLGYGLLFERDYDAAREVFSRNLDSDIDRARVDARAWLARIPLFQGKLRQGLRELSEALAANESEGMKEGEYVWTLYTRATIYAEMGDLGKAIEDTELIIRHMTRLFPGTVTEFREMLVQYLCRAGQTSRADSVLAYISSLIPEESEKEEMFLEMARGLCSLECGDYDSACKHLEVHAGSAFFARYPLGIAYLKAGRLGDAAGTLGAASRDYSHYRAMDPIAAVKVYYHLGRAYEGSGWNDRAAQEYERFLDIWKAADPGIEEIEDAKVRLARLKGAA